MKNVFYFTLKALFILEIVIFLPWLFSYVEKQLDKKVKVNFKIYDITDWETNNYNTHIAKHLKKKRQSGNGIYSIEYYVRNIFLQKSSRKWGRETSFRPLFVFLKKLYIR